MRYLRRPLLLNLHRGGASRLDTRQCPVPIHFAQLGPVTCDEESWMTKHPGHDARFARFFRRAGVAGASEDCSGRSPAAITVRPARCTPRRTRRWADGQSEESSVADDGRRGRLIDKKESSLTQDSQDRLIRLPRGVIMTMRLRARHGPVPHLLPAAQSSQLVSLRTHGASEAIVTEGGTA